MQKYKIIESTAIEYEGHKLYRIEALRDFANVKKGDRGGYVETKDNLSHEGNCWIYDDAKVYGKAQVYGNAQVCGFAKVYGSAAVGNNAEIRGVAEISKTMDYYVGKNIWSSGRFFTYTRSNRMWAVGCFYGTSKELIDKANLDTLVSGREYERIVNYVEAMYKDLEND